MTNLESRFFKEVSRIAMDGPDQFEGIPSYPYHDLDWYLERLTEENYKQLAIEHVHIYPYHD